MRFVSSAALAVLTLAGATAAHAQTIPNLSGTWVLQVDKSSFGMGPAPTSRIDVIDHQEPKLLIKRTIVNAAGGSTTSDLVYVVDGKPYKNTVGTNELLSTLQWDGATLVMTSQTSTPQGEFAITDRYTLAADGKTLTQERVIAAQGQEILQTMILAKQP